MSNQEILYTYFKPVVKAEHMLFAKEIAIKYKILTTNNNPATTFVSNYLQSMCLQIPNYEQLFYITKNGPARVYPKKVYEYAMIALMEHVKGFNKIVTITINNKKYNIKIGGLKNENI